MSIYHGIEFRKELGYVTGTLQLHRREAIGDSQDEEEVREVIRGSIIHAIYGDSKSFLVALRHLAESDDTNSRKDQYLHIIRLLEEALDLGE